MSIETIIALIVAGMLLVLCEIFVPGGIIGSIGGLLVMIGIVAGFVYDIAWGFGLLIGSLIAGIIGFALWVKYFPGSPMGRKLFLDNDAHEWHGFDNVKQELMGKEGIAHSPLRPAGTAIIDAARVDVVTRGEMIAAKEKVKVIAVEGNRVVVTKV